MQLTSAFYLLVEARSERCQPDHQGGDGPVFAARADRACARADRDEVGSAQCGVDDDGKLGPHVVALSILVISLLAIALNIMRYINTAKQGRWRRRLSVRCRSRSISLRTRRRSSLRWCRFRWAEGR